MEAIKESLVPMRKMIQENEKLSRPKIKHPELNKLLKTQRERERAHTQKQRADKLPTPTNSRNKPLDLREWPHWGNPPARHRFMTKSCNTGAHSTVPQCRSVVGPSVIVRSLFTCGV